MRRRGFTLLTLLTLAFTFGVVGCKKKTPALVPERPAPTTPAPPARPPKPIEPPKTEVPETFPQEPQVKSEDIDDQIRNWNAQQVLRTIYFTYDSSELSAEAREILKANADWLKSHRDVKVVTEGHCDERGTIEYNLALGERRANAVRDHLATLGVERARIRILSYGEERPAESGHGEAAWAKNRRAQFLLER
jgi:peptidoglycan-associated lipoprotein